MPKLDTNGNVVALPDEVDADRLQSQITSQIAWLQDKDDDWDNLTRAEHIVVLRRLLKASVAMLKAWRWVLRRLA